MILAITTASARAEERAVAVPSSSTASERTPEQSRDSPARHAFADSLVVRVPVFENRAEARFPTPIPAGHRLVVELVSARCELPPPGLGFGVPVRFEVHARLDGMPRAFYIPLIHTTSWNRVDIYEGNLTGGFYADPDGIDVLLDIGALTTVDSYGCSVTLSGHLERLP